MEQNANMRNWGVAAGGKLTADAAPVVAKRIGY
jgi:hypothetical protein